MLCYFLNGTTARRGIPRVSNQRWLLTHLKSQLAFIWNIIHSAETRTKLNKISKTDLKKKQLKHPLRCWFFRMMLFIPVNIKKHTSNFHCEIFCHHAVPCCKISVNKFVGVEVSHPISNLSCHLNHLLQSWRCLARITLSRIKKTKHVRGKEKKKKTYFHTELQHTFLNDEHCSTCLEGKLGITNWFTDRTPKQLFFSSHWPCYYREYKQERLLSTAVLFVTPEELK